MKAMRAGTPSSMANSFASSSRLSDIEPHLLLAAAAGIVADEDLFPGSYGLDGDKGDRAVGHVLVMHGVWHVRMIVETAVAQRDGGSLSVLAPAEVVIVEASAIERPCIGFGESDHHAGF